MTLSFTLECLFLQLQIVDTLSVLHFEALINLCNKGAAYETVLHLIGHGSVFMTTWAVPGILNTTLIET